MHAGFGSLSLPSGVFFVSSDELFALQEFEEDVREFKLKVEDAEWRLGAVFCQAFDDASGLEHTFKVWEVFPFCIKEQLKTIKEMSVTWTCLQVVEMFGSLLERPLVASDAQSRFTLLWSIFDQELDHCKVLFNKHMGAVDELGEICPFSF